MHELFQYSDATLYAHHSLDNHPKDFPMHAHEMYEIYYFLSGDCSYLVEGCEYALKPHDLLVTRSAEAHKTVFHSSVPYERIVIHFDPSLFDQLDPDGLLLLPFTDRRLGMKNLYRSAGNTPACWNSCFDILHSPSEHAAQKRLHIIQCLLSILDSIAFTGAASADTMHGTTIACDLINYVNAHLFDDLSLRSISEAFFLSPSQLNRLFRRASGSSCWSYIQLKRLLAARELLRQGQPATAVCEACGFRDYSAFYRAYRSHFGVAPSKVQLSIEP